MRLRPRRFSIINKVSVRNKVITSERMMHGKQRNAKHGKASCRVEGFQGMRRDEED